MLARESSPEVLAVPGVFSKKEKHGKRLRPQNP